MTNTPNILFVFPDQLSARWLPCYGRRIVQTPNLDRFASQGVRFDRAYTNSPLCTPYRACLFTGKYPSQTGITENSLRLPDGHRTLADILDVAGYATYYIGKWHLSGDPHGNRWVPRDQRAGFRHFIGWESHHIDHNRGLIWRDDPDAAEALRGHETDGLTDIVCDELASVARSNRPFFMAVSYQAPHPPCSPPDEYYNRYDSSVLAGPPSTDPEAWFKHELWKADYGVEEFRKRYFGEITHLDAAFGRVMDTLDSTGLAQDTIVIFTSDHGEMCGCHGLFGKGVMHDEAVRVPLLVRVPGTARPLVVRRPVSTVDLFATIIELARADSSKAGEGVSFAPDIRADADTPLERDVFIEYHDDCIVRGDVKLVTRRDCDDVTHCFDLARDPFELDNLAGRLDEAVRDDLLRSLKGWRIWTRRSVQRDSQPNGVDV